MTRIGKLELRVPRDRDGRFSTELFARYQRSEKALVSALAEMYVQDVSTRKVKAVTEELCGHTFSASTISRINTSLDGVLSRFAERRLDEAYPYLVLDACYEKMRLDGVIQSQAVLVAIGINWDGRRCVLGVELSNRESRSSCLKNIDLSHDTELAQLDVDNRRERLRVSCAGRGAAPGGLVGGGRAGRSQVAGNGSAFGGCAGGVVRDHPRALPVAGEHHVGSRRATAGELARQTYFKPPEMMPMVAAAPGPHARRDASAGAA